MKGNEKTGQKKLQYSQCYIVFRLTHCHIKGKREKSEVFYTKSNPAKMQNMKVKKLEIYLLLALKKPNVSKLTVIKMHF